MGFIILNRMYNGGYLENSNLGHEVINMYKSDNGNNYIYLQSSGNFDAKKYKNVDCILLVRGIGDSRLEIIGKAEGITPISTKVEDQENYIIENNVKYAGAYLNDIFRDNKTYQDICITFKADNVVKPKEPIYIQYGGAPCAKTTVLTQVNQAKQSLRQYIPQEKSNDYNSLKGIIDDVNLWGNKTKKVTCGNSNAKDPATMFDICGIEYSELAYSNALYYFLKIYREFTDIFLKKVLGISKGIVGDYKVYREKDNIDIFYEDDEKIIIIENKIRSHINGVKKEKGKKPNQLDDYFEKVKDSGKKIYIYVLAPDYNNLDIIFPENDCISKSKRIFYSDLYDIMKGYDAYGKNPYFTSLTDSIKRHTRKYDNTLYDIMEDLFIDRINDLIK